MKKCIAIAAMALMSAGCVTKYVYVETDRFVSIDVPPHLLKTVSAPVPPSRDTVPFMSVIQQRDTFAEYGLRTSKQLEICRANVETVSEIVTKHTEKIEKLNAEIEATKKQ